MISKLLIGVAVAIIVSLPACSSLPNHGVQTDTFPAPSWNPDWLAQPTIDTRQHIVVQPPTPLSPYRAGLLPVRTPPPLPEVSQALTQIFYRALLEQRPFLEVVLIPEPYGSLAEAVHVGRRNKVDVVVLGEAPYFLDGGGMGKSGLQVDLQVVEVKTGRLLWALTDAVTATQRPIVDLWVTETRPRPAPSIYLLAEGLAARMSETLRDRSYAVTQKARP
jgi:hypothetical protein